MYSLARPAMSEGIDQDQSIGLSGIDPNVMQGSLSTNGQQEMAYVLVVVVVNALCESLLRGLFQMPRSQV